MPNWPQLVANLIDEPYCLSMDSIAKLTMRQVILLYFRPRDKNGVPKRISSTWSEEATDPLYERFISLGLALGRSYDDLQREWEIKANGRPS